MKWQNIETAPKDVDKSIIIYCATGDILMAYFDDCCRDGYKWRVHIDGCYAGDPVFWMPLPDSPNSENQDEPMRICQPCRRILPISEFKSVQGL